MHQPLIFPILINKLLKKKLTVNLHVKLHLTNLQYQLTSEKNRCDAEVITLYETQKETGAFEH